MKETKNISRSRAQESAAIEKLYITMRHLFRGFYKPMGILVKRCVKHYWLYVLKFMGI
jgi:hypothetical protein